MTAVNNAQIDTAQKKFGTGSMLLDGIDDEVTTPDNVAWAFGTGKFTIDLFFRPRDLNSNIIMGQIDSPTSFWGFHYSSSGNVLGFASITSGSWDINFTIPVTLDADTWYYARLVRDGTTSGTWHLSIDGVNGTKNLVLGSYGATIFNGTGVLKIGTLDGNLSADNDGWMDEIRVVKGVAVTTGNFTPPTERWNFDSASGTELLLHCDGSDGSTDFIDNSATNPVDTNTTNFFHTS